MQGGQPSRTALKVARSLVYLSHDPEVGPLLPAGAAEATERLLTAAGLLPRWMVRVVAQPWLHRLGTALETVTGAPVAHFGLRKRFIDDEVRAALADGARQVLVVGAGYDTLCLRLAPAFADRAFIEIDHPDTHAVKRAAIAVVAPAVGNLHLIGADLAAAGLPDVLANVPAWDVAAPSVVVAEGLLMYLPAAAIDAFLSGVHRSTGTGTRLIFTWMRRDPTGRPDAGSPGRVMARLLELAGEPWHWSVRDESVLASFLAERGFAFAPDRERFTLPARYLHDPDRAWAPEFMALAERR